MSIVPVCLVGDQPTVPDQNFGQAHGCFLISERVRTAVTNISQANGGLAPVLDPLVQLLKISR
jgi:hypothetical protein